jgi:DinB superfamily
MPPMNNADRQQLLAQLSRTPIQVTELVKGVSPASAVVRPGPDEFSVVENICHLRDIEIDGYAVRIRRLLNEEQPLLADIDGARLAIVRDYNKQNLQDALTTFTQARQANLDALNSASESAFEREGELEGVGTITLGRLLQLMWDHDEGHLDELRNTRTRFLKTYET